MTTAPLPDESLAGYMLRLSFRPGVPPGQIGFSSTHGDSERRFLLDAIGYLHDLADGAGWDSEYPRDVWLPRRLGFPARDAALRFDRIEHLWLRELTKRWARWRQSAGTALSTVLADVRAITLFSGSFPSLKRGPETLTRELIEANLAHLTIKFPNAKSRTGQISSSRQSSRHSPKPPSCCRAGPATWTGSCHSAPPHSAVSWPTGWLPATSAMNSAARCMSPPTSGVTFSLLNDRVAISSGAPCEL